MKENKKTDISRVLSIFGFSLLFDDSKNWFILGMRQSNRHKY